MEHQLVVFDLANEHYGVDIAAVEGIIKMQPITAVPRAPASVEGVTNLRGEVLPVIDLRKRFGLPGRPADQDTRIIVVDALASGKGANGNGASSRGHEGNKVGMVVDGVSEVLRVPAQSVEALSPILTTVDSTFIQGIAKLDERLVILLDLGKVLSAEEQAELRDI
jgi:purine-binding chemotaxis protein CheW